MRSQVSRVAIAATVPLLAAPLLAIAPADAAATVDISKLKTKIQNGIQKQANIKVKAKCPKRVTWTKGKVFYCSVTDPAGRKYRVQVTLGSPASGKLRWKVIT